MWGILGVFLQAAARADFVFGAASRKRQLPAAAFPGGRACGLCSPAHGRCGRADARDQLVRHNLRLVAHVCKKYYAATSNQDDLISIGTIGLIKAVDTFDPARASKFASYASRCIENELRMELRKIRREGAAVSLQEPLESGSGR